MISNIVIVDDITLYLTESRLPEELLFVASIESAGIMLGKMVNVWGLRGILVAGLRPSVAQCIFNCLPIREYLHVVVI